MPYVNIKAWYWTVAGSKTQVYSSAAGAYIPITDQAYQALVQAGFSAAPIAVEQDLFDVLSVAGLPLPAGAAQSAASKAQQAASIPPAIKQAIAAVAPVVTPSAKVLA